MHRSYKKNYHDLVRGEYWYRKGTEQSHRLFGRPALICHYGSIIIKYYAYKGRTLKEQTDIYKDGIFQESKSRYFHHDQNEDYGYRPLRMLPEWDD